MKPALDRMVDRVVASLSGDARKFYDREFDFFNEVTDISGKLKPFIKKTKPEKKVRLCDKVYLPTPADIFLRMHTRPRSTRRWPRSRSTLEYIFPVTPTESLSTSTRSLVDLCRVTPR